MLAIELNFRIMPIGIVLKYKENCNLEQKLLIELCFIYRWTEREGDSSITVVKVIPTTVIYWITCVVGIPLL